MKNKYQCAYCGFEIDIEKYCHMCLNGQIFCSTECIENYYSELEDESNKQFKIGDKVKTDKGIGVVYNIGICFDTYYYMIGFEDKSYRRYEEKDLEKI